MYIYIYIHRVHPYYAPPLFPRSACTLWTFHHANLLVRVWLIQDIVLFLGFCARINTILCAPTLCLGIPPHPRHRPHYCATYYTPPSPLYCNICHIILVMAISCSKGQALSGHLTTRVVRCETLHVESAKRRIKCGILFRLTLCCVMNTVTLNMSIFLSNAGFTRRNTLLCSCGCVPGIREHLFNT